MVVKVLFVLWSVIYCLVGKFGLMDRVRFRFLVFSCLVSDVVVLFDFIIFVRLIL